MREEDEMKEIVSVKRCVRSPIGLFAVICLAGAAIAAQPQKQITVPAGTRVLVRTVDSIDSSKNKVGDKFTATLETNLMAVDTVAAHEGTTVYGRVTDAKAAGRIAGGAELGLELTDIVINGTAYPLLTSTYEVQGKGKGSGTAKKGCWWRRSGRIDRRTCWRRKGRGDWVSRGRCRRNRRVGGRQRQAA